MMKKSGHEDHSSIQEDSSSDLKTAAEIAAEKVAAELTAVTEISQKEMNELRTQASKAQENWERLLRVQADLDNYRKRMTRERQDLIKSANEKLLQDLLAPLDHFEMGLQSAQKNSKEEDPLRQGMEIVLAQFQQFLKSHGITEIQSMGQMFDPALHEAVAHQSSDAPEGHVIQQIRKGYRLNDKLLRPASVIVSKGKTEYPEEFATETSPS